MEEEGWEFLDDCGMTVGEGREGKGCLTLLVLVLKVGCDGLGKGLDGGDGVDLCEGIHGVLHGVCGDGGRVVALEKGPCKVAPQVDVDREFGHNVACVVCPVDVDHPNPRLSVPVLSQS